MDSRVVCKSTLHKAWHIADIRNVCALKGEVPDARHRRGVSEETKPYEERILKIPHRDSPGKEVLCADYNFDP